MTPGEEAAVSREEYEARHNDLVTSISRLADSVSLLAKTQVDNQVTNVSATSELRGYVRGTTTAVSIVTGVVLAVVAAIALLFH